MTVEPTSTTRLRKTSILVRAPVPFHSLSAIPQSVLKMMMLAIFRVQLEKPYFPIWVAPML